MKPVVVFFLNVLKGLAFSAALAVSNVAALGAEPVRSDIAVHRLLTETTLWRAYKVRFVTEQGRVVDTGNNAISHSEGQGYGMLLAVAADNRADFDRIWGWTRANLFVRNDHLAAWRWEADKRPAVADMNNATDGDLLIAWALTEAAEAWSEVSYRVAARRIAVEIGRKLILHDPDRGPLLLPGMSGFSPEHRADGPVLNLSYYVFPAIARLSLVAPEFNWTGLSRTGVQLIDKARFGPPALPSDWITLKSQTPQPATGFPAQFSYNSIRIPLYMAWAGLDQQSLAERFKGSLAAGKRGSPAVVDVNTGSAVAQLDETGYEALPALSACASSGVPIPARLRTPRLAENYYPVTLHLLALIATRAKYPQCLRN